MQGGQAIVQHGLQGGQATAATDGDGAKQACCPTEQRHFQQLFLEYPRLGGQEQRQREDLQHGLVLGKDEAWLPWQVLEATDLERKPATQAQQQMLGAQPRHEDGVASRRGQQWSTEHEGRGRSHEQPKAEQGEGRRAHMGAQHGQP
jgi:hypothetical protein